MARAQQAPLPVIGFLHQASSQPFDHSIDAFRRGLQEEGYVEGRNVTLEFRWADGEYDRLPVLAADLVRAHANVILSAFPRCVVHVAHAPMRQWCAKRRSIDVHQRLSACISVHQSRCGMSVHQWCTKGAPTMHLVRSPP
jgi:hypothetical protein